MSCASVLHFLWFLFLRWRYEIMFLIFFQFLSSWCQTIRQFLCTNPFFNQASKAILINTTWPFPWWDSKNKTWSVSKHVSLHKVCKSCCFILFETSLCFVLLNLLLPYSLLMLTTISVFHILLTTSKFCTIDNYPYLKK